jgi:DNA-binding transcriptional LysR family regulator
MTTEQLQHFLMLAECLNYTAAAERLFISQSTLSRSISAFEAELQTKLFERGKNRVTLTPAGKLMRDRAPEMLYRMHALEVDCRELGDGVRGRLHIGIPDDQQVTPQAVRAAARFHRDNPNITLVYDAGPLDELKTRLVTGACDVVLAAQFGADPCVGLRAQCYAVDEPVTASDRTIVLSVCAGEGITLANRWSAFYGLPSVRCIRLTGLPEKPLLTALSAVGQSSPLVESFLRGLTDEP